MQIDDYVKIFETAACKQTYVMTDGVDAVVKAVIDQIHDMVIDDCETSEECRERIINYSLMIRRT